MYEEKEIKIKKVKKQKNNKSNKQNIPAIFLKINWFQLIFKLFILIMSMMLIIYTLSRVQKHNEKQIELFKNNIEIIENAALKYFENDKLPKNIGDSSSFILEEMKNLKLIDEIKDSENKSCNYPDSYIILTKTAIQEYHLKIYLKCSNSEKNVEEKLICNENECKIQK